ncbi:hypothetical protein [Streptomyces sp. TE33382]
MAGQLEADLLVVAYGERVLAGPREDGFDEALVRFAIQRKFRLDQSVGVVQDRVRAGAWRASLPGASRAGGRRSPLVSSPPSSPVVLVLVVLAEEPGEAAVRAGEQGR